MKKIWVDGSGKGEIGVIEEGYPMKRIQTKAYKDIHIIEYMAVLEGLKRFKPNEKGIIYTDSKHIADQLNGCKIRKRNWVCRMFRDIIHQNIKNLRLELEIIWIPRHENLAGLFMS